MLQLQINLQIEDQRNCKQFYSFSSSVSFITHRAGGIRYRHQHGHTHTPLLHGCNGAERARSPTQTRAVPTQTHARAPRAVCTWRGVWLGREGVGWGCVGGRAGGWGGWAVGRVGWVGWWWVGGVELGGGLGGGGGSGTGLSALVQSHGQVGGWVVCVCARARVVCVCVYTYMSVCVRASACVRADSGVGVRLCALVHSPGQARACVRA